MQVCRGDGSVIAVAVAGARGGAPVLFCHGLADSRLSAGLFAPAARELGLRVAAPDRPGTGGADPRRLRRVVDWVQDAALVLDGLGAGPAALVGGRAVRGRVRRADARPGDQPHPRRAAGAAWVA